MGFIREIRRDIEQEALCLMREYRSLLLAEAKQLTNDDSVAEDLVMKTIESYLAQPDEGLPAKGKVRAWLRTTLRNHFNNSVRGKARACTVYLDEEDAARIDEIAPADNSSDEAILAHSDAELVRNVLARLPQSARSVIVMHYFESLTIRQIAELLRKSPDSVKSNLYYARKVLAKRLGKMMGRAALAIAALIFGGSLLYAAAVATGLAPSPFAADEESEVVFNAKSTENTEDSLTGLTGFTGLSEAGAPPQTPNHESSASAEATAGMRTTNPELTTTNLTTTNNEETTMNTQVVKSAAVKMMAAGAMLAATAPALSVRSARADSLKNYQVLQYLESSGTQAIDTGVKYADDTCLYTQMQVLNNNTGGHIGAIDQCSDNINDRFHFRVDNSTFWAYAAHSESGSAVNSVGDGWNQWFIDKINNRIFKNGSSAAGLALGAYGTADDSHSTIWLFGRNSNNSSYRQYATVRLSLTVIFHDDSLERQMIPCRRLSDNELGMYDLVRREFLTNIGTGSFTAGPEGLGCAEIPPQIYSGQSEICPEVVVKNAGQTRVEGRDYTVTYSDNTAPGIGKATITGIGDYADCGSVVVRFAIVPEEAKLPGEYQRVAYLESTKGGGQVIDTGIHPTGSMQMEIRFQAPRLAQMSLFGAIYDKGGTYERYHVGRNSTAGYYEAGLGTWTSGSGGDSGRNWTTILLRTRGGNGRFEMNGELKSWGSAGSFSPSDNMTIWLFGRNSNTESLKRNSACRLMYAEFCEGDSNPPTLTHRLVPCRRIADGELGVYDTVARQFLYDTGRAARGAAAFVAGPDVGDSWRPGTIIRLN